ncbi:MAG: hypothetical protein KDC58_12255 [Cyclobacteriaceae bacterium]|nr:hypothetical protein [Cyclobacteriaceae bacterium]
MMEFEEMQKIWNTQKGETMYAINEATLHKSISNKKDAAGRRINKVEIGISLINGFTAILLLFMALNGPNKWGFITSGLFLATVVYILYFRMKRKKAENTFDRSMLGELDHAISNTNASIKFNYLMIVGYLVPLSVNSILEMAYHGASPLKWLVIIVAYALAFVLIRWEQKTRHIFRKEQLIALKKKLLED